MTPQPANKSYGGGSASAFAKRPRYGFNYTIVVIGGVEMGSRRIKRFGVVNTRNIHCDATYLYDVLCEAVLTAIRSEGKVLVTMLDK